MNLLVAFTCHIDSSYSNLLQVYSLKIRPLTKTAFISYLGSLSAHSVGLSMYKVTKLLTIPGSELVVSVIEGMGAQLLNLTRLQDDADTPISEIVLCNLDISQKIVTEGLSEQYYQEKGPL